jgi:short-subunit dehydrogenase
MGVVHGVHAAYPLMIAQGQGHIVNTASLAGISPSPGLTPYSASKHAVVGLSRSLRAEARQYGVKVSVVCPGMVKTPILERSETRSLDGDALRAKLMFGAITPDDCAKQILTGVRKNKDTVLVTSAAKLTVFLLRFCPWLVNFFVKRIALKVHETHQG